MTIKVSFSALLMLFLTLSLAAEEAADMHSSRISLDWHGTYRGVLPTASGGGAETQIILREDGTYQKKIIYLEQRDNVFIKEGEFEWNESGSAIRLLNIKSSPSWYIVGENRLFQLDMEGERISDELEEHHILRKVD